MKRAALQKSVLGYEIHHLCNALFHDGFHFSIVAARSLPPDEQQRSLLPHSDYEQGIFTSHYRLEANRIQGKKTVITQSMKEGKMLDMLFFVADFFVAEGNLPQASLFHTD